MELNGVAVSFDNVTKIFESSTGAVRALEHATMCVYDGEFVSLIGPSGCGKSTILRLISNVLEPTSGTIGVGGTTAYQARIQGMVNLMFQEPILLPWLTIHDNVALGQKLTKPENPPDPRTLLEIVGLQGRENDYPFQLSGGMQQRAALARAIATNPKILLMDEPFASVDEFTRDRMGRWLLSIWQQTKKTILFVTHSIPEAVYLSDRVIVMGVNPGRILTEVTVPLPRPRTDSMRESAEYFQQLIILREYLYKPSGSSNESDE